MPRSDFPTRVSVLVIGLVLAAATGCGPSMGNLTGKITYNGTPLKGGSVTLIGDGDGQAYSTTIQEDGSYTLAQVPSGKYKVCVETNSVRGGGGMNAGSGGPANAKLNAPGGKLKEVPASELPPGYRQVEPYGGSPAERAKRYVEIPAKYASPDQTPLTVEVKGSNLQHDIPLS